MSKKPDSRKRAPRRPIPQYSMIRNDFSSATPSKSSSTKAASALTPTGSSSSRLSAPKTRSRRRLGSLVSKDLGKWCRDLSKRHPHTTVILAYAGIHVFNFQVTISKSQITKILSFQAATRQSRVN
jgi:hypothetical protein